ncbi:MAG: sigma 54-interacting transcriptional regulator [Blastocatellia bacterium]|nr:sigma 54-interacting transcriptional regulator [Blastocatellia bacterium]
MLPEELKLFDLLRHDEAAGTIHIKNRRVLLIDADAFGLLRKGIIEQVDALQARRILAGFGYARGFRDALTCKDLFAPPGAREWAQAGIHLHAQEGFVSPRPSYYRIEPEAGIFEAEGEWVNSFEAEQHLKHLGPCEIPVCWTLIGYASGFQSAVMGREVFFIETECIGKGDARCRYLGTTEVGAQSRFSQLLPKLYKTADPEAAIAGVRRQRADLQLLVTELEQRSKELAAQQQRVRELETQLTYLQEAIKETYNFEEMIGSNQAFQKVVRDVGQVAKSDATVLILGETGTGKELLARALHARSLRAAKPLVTVNCAALPAGLVESELFGHEKGSFTGAIQRKLGRFELAHGSTIFLDEVGEIPLETQSKFLRVLQEGEFERVGGSQPIHTNVRVIAATNQPLEKLVEAGKFRADLYYRLNVFPITLPPLRERGGDVLLLASFFVQKFRARFKKHITSISTESLEKLKRYRWPGNVRELEHVIERAVLISQSDVLTVDLPLSAEPVAPVLPASVPTALVTLEENERAYIAKVLEHTGGLIAGKGGAAEILGLPSTTLRSRMQKLGLLPNKKG